MIVHDILWTIVRNFPLLPRHDSTTIGQWWEASGIPSLHICPTIGQQQKSLEMTNTLTVKTTHRSATIRRLPNPGTDRLGIHAQSGLVIVPFAEILFCEAMSNYCRIHLFNGRSHIVSKPLKRIISVLPAEDFVRTHQSYVVRLNEIDHVGQEIILSNGIQIPLARSQRNSLLNVVRKRITII